MQYQVFKKDTGEVIAWIDTEDCQAVLHKDYDIKIGDSLMAIEVEENPPIKAVAKFEKVSLEQWCKDNESTLLPKEYFEEQHKDLKCPIRKTKGSAGYDFLAPYDITINPHETVLIKTGIKCQIDEGYVLELYPRSSLGFKYNLTLDNTVGIIDSDYYNNPKNEGHIMCKMTNHSDDYITIKAGDGYMQGLFKEFFITKDDVATAERVGGIGSTNS